MVTPVALTRLNLALLLALSALLAISSGPALAQTDDADFFDSLDEFIPAEEQVEDEATPDAGGDEPAPDETQPDDPFGGELNDLLSGDADQVSVPAGLTVVLRGLDKVTGRTTEFDVPVEEPVTFGALTITARYCEKAPPEETPEVSAFLQIDARNNQGEVARAFSGWMFASSPALSALEHPVYDVWVMDCKIVAPSKDDGAAENKADAASAGSN